MQDHVVPPLVDAHDRGEPRRPAGPQRARADPGRVAFSAQGRRAAGSTSRPPSSPTDVRAVAKGLIAAGIGTGDRVAIMSQTRYEWTLADFAIWTAGAVPVPDLRDVLGRAGRSGSSPTPAPWASSSRPPRTRRPSPRCAARCPACEHVWAIDAGATRQPEPPPAPPSTTPTSTARRSGTRPRQPRDDHLHLGHHRPAQGLRADPRQLPDARRERRRAARARSSSADGASTLLFLPLAHVFARFIQVLCVDGRGQDGPHAPTSRPCSTDFATFQPTFILVRAAGLREDLQLRRGRRPTAERQGQDLRRRRRHRHRLVEALGRREAPASACGCGTRSSTSSSTASCARRWAARCSTPCPAARRSAPASATSSAASASRSSRATASPRPPRRPPSTSPSGSRSARSARRCPASASASPTTARSCIQGINVFRGYHNNDDAPPPRPSATAGSTPATSASSTTTATCASPAARRRSSSPPAARTSRPRCSRTACAPTRWSASASSSATRSRSSPPWSPSTRRCTPAGPGTTASRACAFDAGPHRRGGARRDPAGRRRRQQAVSKAESIRKFAILEGDFTEENGHLTPSLKLKRNVVMKDFADRGRGPLRLSRAPRHDRRPPLRSSHAPAHPRRARPSHSRWPGSRTSRPCSGAWCATASPSSSP